MDRRKGIFSTIKKDLTEENLFRKFRNEIVSLKNFYLDAEKQIKIKRMYRIVGWFYIVWWILKEMFFRLNPVRRVILLVAFALLIGSVKIVYGEEVSLTFGDSHWGTILILLVLMLELKDKLIAHEELDAGRQVQQALLPEQTPKVKGWDIWLYTQPANNVGGDLVDFIKLSSKPAYGIAIADVAGKGLKSALLATKLQTILHIFLDSDESLTDRVNQINQSFCKESLKNIFASVIYLELRENENTIEFVNAGHFPPLLIKENEIIEFEKGDVAIGLMKDTNFHSVKLNLNDDEIFVAYSDGLIEAQNELGQFYGIERLKKILTKFSALSSKEIGERVLTSLEHFIGDYLPKDDLSLIIIKLKKFG